MQGKITISRPVGHNIEVITIDIEDESSGVSFLSVQVGYANFTKALTGQAYIPCEFEIRGLEVIGKRRETKTEHVFVPDGSHETRDKRAYNAVKQYEKDGWKGRREDALNFNKRKEADAGGAWYEVTFTRHVENESG